MGSRSARCVLSDSISRSSRLTPSVFRISLAGSYGVRSTHCDAPVAIISAKPLPVAGPFKMPQQLCPAHESALRQVWLNHVVIPAGQKQLLCHAERSTAVHNQAATCTCRAKTTKSANYSFVSHAKRLRLDAWDQMQVTACFINSCMHAYTCLASVLACSTAMQAQVNSKQQSKQYCESETAEQNMHQMLWGMHAIVFHTCCNVGTGNIGMLTNDWGSIWGQRPDACLLLHHFSWI